MNKDHTTKVNIILRNPIDESQIHTLSIIPKDIPIGKKWLEKLKICLDNNLKIEKNFCWVGWPDSPRNLNYLTAELRKHVKTINDYNKSLKCKWETEYYITEEFFPDTVMTKDLDVNHDLFNRLHHHFEVLQGQVWNISDWFINADNETRYAIRQLNNLCHEMEILIKQIRAKKYHPEYMNPASIIAFLDGPREELELDDHDHFTLQRGGGRVYLGYCQIGKIHWEAFIDGDEHIGSDGISGLRYVSGEVTIDFGTDTLTRKEHQYRISEYKTWLEKNGLQLEDKSLAHGWLHVADVDFTQYIDAGLNLQQTQEFLSNFLDIYKIQIIENDVITKENIFDYHWNKSDFESQQKAALFPTYKSFCNNTD